MVNAAQMAGVILAGGLGSRLGGVIKPLLRVGGETILERTIYRLRPLASPLYLSTGAVAPQRFAGFDLDGLVPDRADVSGGPLAGIFAVAAVLRSEGYAVGWLLSAAGDCPDLPANLPQALLAVTAPDVDVAFAAFRGQSYPPIALWRFSALLTLMDAMGGDPQGKGPRQLVTPDRRRDVDFADAFADNPFESLNTLGDLIRLARTREPRSD